MESNKLANWIQVLTSIALLVGLGLVIWELRQTREIATAQEIRASFSAYSSQLQAMMGEESARAVAKACDAPGSLTTEDMLVLHHFHTEIINRLRVELHLASKTDLAAFGWESWADSNFAIIFATEFGTWWWQNSLWEPEIMQYGARWFEENGPVNCKDHWDGYRAAVAANAPSP